MAQAERDDLVLFPKEPGIYWVQSADDALGEVRKHRAGKRSVVWEAYNDQGEYVGVGVTRLLAAAHLRAGRS